MLKRLFNLPRLFSRDERGQAMVMTALLSFVLFRSVVMSYNVGVAVSQKIRAQTVADMAAYSGAIWQARFLNYCAYTRRAILANYAQIAMMNSAIVNKRAMDNIHEASEIMITFMIDVGLVSDMLDILESVRDMVIPDDFGNVIPNFTDGREVADHMNYILAESQDGLFWAISPIEMAIFQKIIDDCALQSGDLIQANLSHSIAGSILEGTFMSGFPLTAAINGGLLGQALGIPPIPFIGAQVGQPIIERRRIPLDEIEPLFDFGMTLPSVPHFKQFFRFPWPIHWGGGPLMGRPFISGDPQQPSCNNCIDGPFIQFVTTFPEDTEFVDGFVRSREMRALPIDMPFLNLFGVYQFMPVWCRWCIGPIVFDLPPAISLPVILMYTDLIPMPGNNTQSTNPTPKEVYRLKVPLDEVLVYEMKNGLQPRDLEPSVYAAVAQPLASTPYFRFTNGRNLGLLDNAEDIVTISRAKVYFKPPFENLNARIGGRPNLHYPFWGARLARIKDGRNGDVLFFGTRPIVSMQNLMDVTGLARPLY